MDTRAHQVEIAEPTHSQIESDGHQYTGSGDVKYHLGTSFHRPTSSGKRVYLSLMANPR